MINRLFFLIIVLSYCLVSHLEAAELYQCGNDTYQQVPCNEGVEQKTLKPDISKKGVQFSKPSVIIEQAPQSSSEKRNLNWINNLQKKYNTAQKFCRSDRNGLKKAKQRIIDTCKQRRDTYCHESVEKIADRNYNKAARSSSRPGWSPNHELNGFSSNTQYCKEAKRIKKQLKDNYDVTVY
ncbi:hypothetical protein CXF85_12205 [Colwellia sp. 75C3]|uniref:DUF4124 domain-containing protein n=1 Tax=Colwellia sp. 75C3 TaxID=888425 RepID=UPI000C32AB4F|nr:DUF4124 domain-containing protein [Colwellia sp. 75C3]PKG82889.1 hypothetical protein CXF85_12205 [Colwellia sp. 75C3]